MKVDERGFEDEITAFGRMDGRLPVDVLRAILQPHANGRSRSAGTIGIV